MQLTQAQKTALKTDMQANTNTTPTPGADGQTFVVNTRLTSTATADQQAIADWYNQQASPAYWGVRTDASVVAIRNAIQWPKYTPAPTVTSGNAAQAGACANYCQAKQFNLQLILGVNSAGTFDASQPTQTNGIKDATTSLPSAASFANQDANWTGAAGCVANQLVRQMTNVEKLLASANSVPALSDGVSARGAWTTSSGSGNPDMFGAQGTLTPSDVADVVAHG